ncbi:MAG: hypothetical protein U0802_19745 [Candidatus Binatia bacterium]
MTALSSALVARIKRDGSLWEQSFARGVPTGRIRKVGPARGTGTTVTFTADRDIFPNTRFRPG